MMDDSERASWRPGRWWNVVAPDGSLWCGTSNEGEARRAMRPGDTLWREWVYEDREWREVDPAYHAPP